jgi:hypothetical protein
MMADSKIATFATKDEAVAYADAQGLTAIPYPAGYPGWILLVQPVDVLAGPWAVRTDGLCEYLSEW